MNIRKAAADLAAKHGSYRKAAAVTGISFAQLFKLAKGQHKNPTVQTLKRLGLI